MVHVYILVLHFSNTILSCLLSMYVMEFHAAISCPLPSIFPK